MNKIPKKIHYCWFGNGPIPEKDKKCIESWKKYCPDYEIIKWDESNYDITKNKYMHEAYINKKWGFVPDFARLDIIYNEGGFYLDTDVELVKSLDELIDCGGFMGFEGGTHISPGLGFGAYPKHPMIKELMSIYQDITFVNEDGSFNITPSPVMNTNFLVDKGFLLNNTYQEIDDFCVFPSDYFCPMDYNTGLITLTDNTVSIHRYNMSWVDPVVKKWHYREQKLNQKINRNVSRIIIRIVSFPDRVLNKFKKLGLKGTFKFIISKIYKK